MQLACHDLIELLNQQQLETLRSNYQLVPLFLMSATTASHNHLTQVQCTRL